MYEGSDFSISSPKSVVSISAILMGVNLYLIVVLICISLVTDVEYIFMCLLTIFLSSVDKCLFKSCPHFKFRLFVFLMLTYNSS